MSKYIPPEKMTAEQIRVQIDTEFRNWNDLANGKCHDPFWPDGMNMNLTRGHIIYWYGYLAEKISAGVQLSLFGAEFEPAGERPVPPEVPDEYMVIDGEYPHRLDDNKAMWPRLVWGRKGEYHA